MRSDDTEFIHVDLNNGKRVACWHRGSAGAGSQVVVVANFSPLRSDSQPGGNGISSAQLAEHTAGTALARGHPGTRCDDRMGGARADFPWEAKVNALI